MVQLRRRPPTNRRPAPPPTEHRAQFRVDLQALDDEMQAMATQACNALDLSMEAIEHPDAETCRQIVDGDDTLDARCLDIQRRAVEQLGLQQPVASDLRLLVALIQVALHLERIGDMAVNVAQVTQGATAPLPSNDETIRHLQDMGELAVTMTRLAVKAFTGRDRALCEQLPDRDERVDRLHRSMIDHAVVAVDDPKRGETTLRMLQVSRYLERAADHAVDIAEQAWSSSPASCASSLSVVGTSSRRARS